MVDSPIKTYFSVKHPHKFVLFIATIIFVLSLFTKAEISSPDIVRITSLRFMIVGLVWWLIYDWGVFLLDILWESDVDGEGQKILTILAIIAWIAILLFGSLIGAGVILT